MATPFTASFRPAAERFYANATEDVQRHFDDVMDRLKSDPYVDGETKVDFPYPPAICVLYTDDVVQILYYIDTQRSDVDVWSAAPSNFAGRLPIR